MARSRSGTSPRPRRTSTSTCTAVTIRSPTRTRSSSARTSSSAVRARRACSSFDATCCATGCPTCPAAARSRTSTRPSTATSTDPAHREEGGTPAIVESIRAGLVFQLKQAVGIDVIRAHEEHYLRRAVDGLASRAGHRDPRQPRRRAAVDRVVRRARAERPLPASQLRRRVAQRPVRHPVARRLFVRRPLRPSPARHRPRPIARVRARDRAAAAKASSPAGSASTSTTSSPSPSSRTSSTPFGWSRATGGGCSPTTSSTRPPACGGIGADWSNLRCG